MVSDVLWCNVKSNRRAARADEEKALSDYKEKLAAETKAKNEAEGILGEEEDNKIELNVDDILADEAEKAKEEEILEAIKDEDKRPVKDEL